MRLARTTPATLWILPAPMDFCVAGLEMPRGTFDEIVAGAKLPGVPGFGV